MAQIFPNRDMAENAARQLRMGEPDTLDRTLYVVQERPAQSVRPGFMISMYGADGEFLGNW